MHGSMPTTYREEKPLIFLTTNSWEIADHAHPPGRGLFYICDLNAVT
jgi:hypothetical protein